MFVSVVSPSYKKEDTIIQDITILYNTLENTRYDFEIIIVEDGYLDNTRFVFRQFLDTHPKISEKITFVGYPTNHGKGYALRYGMARAKGEYIAMIDDGSQINPNGISMLMEHMLWYDADIVVASKRHPASKTNIGLLRRFYSWGYYLGVRFLFGIKVSDTQTGLKIYKREVLERVLPRLLVKEYAIDIEILSVANHLGFTRIYDAPVEVKLDFGQQSKFKMYKPLFFDPFIRQMLLDTLAIFYRLHILGYYNDASSRHWKFDEELMLRVNTGEMGKSSVKLHLEDTVSSTEKDKYKFSVIIPVRSINTNLKQSIINLQALQFKSFEVLIITDGPEEYPFKDERFKIIAAGSVGPGEKRNLGADHAKGEILTFLDDDAYPASGWLTHAAEIFDDSDIDALGAPAITPAGVGFLERCAGRVLESSLTAGSTLLRHVPSRAQFVKDYVTVNLFVRRDVFFDIGGFTTEFWPGEDTKLCLDIIKATGKDIRYDPNPIVYHHRRNLFIPHLKQFSRYGQHRGQFSRIFPETSRLPLYFFPTLFVLGLVLGPVASYYVPMLWIPYATTLIFYFGLVLYEAVRSSLDDKNLFEIPYIMLGIFTTHFVYGTNFIVGLIRKPKLQLKGIDLASGNYTEG